MDSLERMNLALAYIEDNLSDEIEMQRVEQLALCSEYHFRRMFSFLAGVPLSEYIRRRRLTLAAFELQQSGVSVLDTAVKCATAHPTRFSRFCQPARHHPQRSQKQRPAAEGVSTVKFPINHQRSK